MLGKDRASVPEASGGGMVRWWGAVVRIHQQHHKTCKTGLIRPLPLLNSLGLTGTTREEAAQRLERVFLSSRPRFYTGIPWQ